MTQSRLDAIREVIDWPRGSFARRRLTLEIEVHRLRQRMAASAAKRGLSVPHALQLRRKAHVRVLSAAEPVLMVAVGGTPRLWMVRTLARELRGRPAVFLLLLYWSAESEASVSVFHREAERFRADFPDHALVFLCNTARERELFRAAGETAFFANHNMLVREDVFRPLTDVSPRFDAVYNAKLAVFKRHSLAALVAQRALVTYVDGVDMPPAASRAFSGGWRWTAGAWSIRWSTACRARSPPKTSTAPMPRRASACACRRRRARCMQASNTCWRACPW